MLERRPDIEPQPPGLCECGCGEQTGIVQQTDPKRGYVKGERHRFVVGHMLRIYQRPPLSSDDYAEEDRGYATPCWIWLGSANNKGYGKVRLAGRDLYAHRAMYEQEVGPIPDGLQLDHLCRVPLCVRPEHLEPVTGAVNIRRGKSAKITEEQLASIRADTRSLRAIAKDYGVAHTTILKIRKSVRLAP